MSWALGIASPLADAWNADNKIVLIVALWLGLDGALTEPADNPPWCILYTTDDDSGAYGVPVHYDGHTETGEGEDEPEITADIEEYADDDIEDWLQVASEEMENHPAPLEVYDYALSLLRVELLDRDYATVYFFQEDDQDTDYDPEEWENLDIFNNFYAWVMIDAVGDNVILTSW